MGGHRITLANNSIANHPNSVILMSKTTVYILFIFLLPCCMFPKDAKPAISVFSVKILYVLLKLKFSPKNK